MRYGQGVALVLVAGMLWSLMRLGLRQIEAASVWQILFWRSVGATVVLFAFIWWKAGGRLFGAIRRVGLAGAIGGFGLVFAFAGSIYAIQTTPVANAVFLFTAALIGAVILALGMMASTLGSRVIPAAELVLLSLIEVLLAPVWVFLFLGETASTGTFIGGGALLAAVVLNAVMGARRPDATGVAETP